MKSLKTNKTATWLTATTSDDAGLLDLLIYTRYGERRLNSVGQILEDDVDKVADIEFLLHGVEWDRLWASYVAEYNPIWNVDGTISETETRDLEANHTGTDTIAKSGSDTLGRTGTDALAKTGTEAVAQTGTDTVTNTGTTTTDNGINGFDSAESVQAGVSVTTPDLTNTNTKNLTDTKTLNTTDTTTHNTTDTQTYNSSNTDTKNLKDTDEGTITRVTERTGNIGVTKTQELLESDRDYWLNLKSLFYENVMTDIINDICYKICVDI